MTCVGFLILKVPCTEVYDVSDLKDVLHPYMMYHTNCHDFYSCLDAHEM